MWSVAVAFLAGVAGLGVSTRFLVRRGAPWCSRSLRSSLSRWPPGRSCAGTGMTVTADALRRVEVRLPSARGELGNVVRFSMVMVIGVWSPNEDTSRR